MMPIQRHSRFLALTFVIACALLAKPARSTEICVINQTPDVLYIEVTTWSKSIKREVEPTSRICAEGDSSGEVIVATDPEAYDACEHLIQPGRTELLLRFNFGMCQWALFVPDS